MRYKVAKKLHDEDEVTVKKTNVVLRVMGDIIPHTKDVYVPCDDGNTYHHTELR